MQIASETGALKKAYDALNRNDIPAMTQSFDPQIEWSLPLGFPRGGTYQGLAAVEALLSESRARWAEGSCEPERFIVAGDRIIVFVHVHVRLQDETEWREGHVADVFTFRDGRAIQFCTFVDERQALEWAGANASD